MFKTAYDSAWQHPGVAWIAAGAFAFLAMGLRRPRTARWRWLFAILQVEIVLDAWLTGARTPLSGGAAENAAIAFVVLGDLRFFYLIWGQIADRRGRALALAAAVSLIVPAGTGILHAVSPRFSGNLLYLVYEAAMVVLVLAVARIVGRGDASPAVRAYVRRVVWFELTQYLAWVVADALILSGDGGAVAEAGWALRMIPNAMYYAAFAPWATWTAPDEARG